LSFKNEKKKKKTMDDAPLSLYGIPLYINTLQVMLDDGVVHTALCRRKKKKEQSATTWAGAAALVFYLFSSTKFI
jgi:hypothetical protein